MSGLHSATLGRALHGFFTDYLPKQRALSPHTLHSYRDSLKLLLRFVAGKRGDPAQLTVEQLTVERTLAFLQHLEASRRNRASTRNVRLSAIHSFFRYLGSQHPEHLEHAQRILSVPFKRTGTREIQHLDFAEIQAVLGVIDRTRRDGRRDFALLNLMFNTGARVSEIVALQACDLRLTSPPSLLLRGKGRKERVCPLWPATAQLLRGLLEERSVSPTQPVAVFLNHRGAPLTRFGVRLILQKHVRKAAQRQPSLKAKRLSAAARKRWKCGGLKIPDISTRPEDILLGFVQMAANSGSFDGAWATGRENFPTSQPTLPIDLLDAFEIGGSGDHGDQPDNYRVLRTHVGFGEV